MGAARLKAIAAPVASKTAPSSSAVFADDDEDDDEARAALHAAQGKAKSAVRPLPLLDDADDVPALAPAAHGGHGAGAGMQAQQGTDAWSHGTHGHGQGGSASAARTTAQQEEEAPAFDDEEEEDAYYEAWKEAMRKAKEAEQLQAQAQAQAGDGGSTVGSASGSGPQPHAALAAQHTGEDVDMAGASTASALTASVGAGLKRPRPTDDAASVASSSVPQPRGAGHRGEGARLEEDEDIALYASEEWGVGGKSALDMLREKLSAKVIKPVDHSNIDYSPFPKCFYVEHPEVRAMTAEAVAEARADAEIAVRGRAVPRPIQTWEHSGLPAQLLSGMPGRGFTAPFAIQKQALPVIMSGRDVIGVARTGSGKTLAYVLPMIRHVMAQEPLGEGEGPIALVLAPARELVVQIYHETRRFCKHLGMRAVAVYGGAPVAEQIGEMKRGSEVLIATPGRLIDLLTLNSGKLISFSRVTYVCLDEADRMFDLGFAPQVEKIMSLIRPDRQTVMFSATFPSHVETLARKALRVPVEIVVGGRSKASPDISQWVEVREEGSKFARTLQLLGEWYERGSILVFVDTQERCDELFAALYKAGYPALSLHGGKDQADRDQALADFKAGLRTLMVATSVAGRGLDVKNLCLVLNYSCPNHLEDYVHRVGRTGRAGMKGTAFTFITSGEAAYASDLMRALKDARQEEHIPAELRALAEVHAKGVADGTARKRASGYANAKGYKFDDSELSAAAKARKVARQAAEIEAGLATVEDILEEQDRERSDRDEEQRLREEKESHAALVEPGSLSVHGVAEGDGGHEGPSASTSSTSSTMPPLTLPADGASRAAVIAMQIQRQLAASGKLNAEALAGLEGGGADGGGEGGSGGVGGGGGPTSDEFEINDYPQQARWRLLKEALRRIEEAAGVAITSKGAYVAPGRKPPAGERKLYLLIEGKSGMAVRQARVEARRVLEEETLRLGVNLDRGGPGAYGKYNIV